MRCTALPLIDPDRCTGCAKCVVVCPFEAIGMVRVQDKRVP